MKLSQLFFGTNLKMYQTASETAAFLGELAQLTADLREEPVVRFVIPSFPSLPAAGAVERNGIRLGAQNMHWENAGQYTGEVSPLMLRDLGCIDLVEIGHSERRQLFGETNQQCNQKVLSALANGFTALLCVGETAAEKYYSISDETLAIQLKVGLADVSPAEIAVGRVWIAYEPVWAIGVNGKPAPPAYVQERPQRLRLLLRELYPGQCCSVPLLYGGSVNSENASAYIGLEDVDGLFVGRAAWNASAFDALLRQVYAVWKEKDGLSPC